MAKGITNLLEDQLTTHPSKKAPVLKAEWLL